MKHIIITPILFTFQHVLPLWSSKIHHEYLEQALVVEQHIVQRQEGNVKEHVVQA